jgi:hypothetical protein
MFTKLTSFAFSFFESVQVIALDVYDKNKQSKKQQILIVKFVIVLNIHRCMNHMVSVLKKLNFVGIAESCIPIKRVSRQSFNDTDRIVSTRVGIAHEWERTMHFKPYTFPRPFFASCYPRQ